MASNINRKLIKSLTNEITAVEVSYDNSATPEPLKQAFLYNVAFRVKCNKAIKDNFKWESTYENEYVILSTEASHGCNYGISDILDIF